MTIVPVDDTIDGASSVGRQRTGMLSVNPYFTHLEKPSTHSQCWSLLNAIDPNAATYSKCTAAWSGGLAMWVGTERVPGLTAVPASSMVPCVWIDSVCLL